LIGEILMKKLKLYLDTSVISHLHADDVPEKMEKTIAFWDLLITEEFEPYISELVIAEFNKCPEPKKSQLELIIEKAPLNILEVDEEATVLADKYIEQGIFPGRYRDDAIHVALATVYGCNVIVSWNFKHMVKIRTILGVNGVNKITGYSDIEIVTPEVIVGEGGDLDE
jgi:predicted nucleic acid-binding protein